jgi:hypothetical protein
MAFFERLQERGLDLRRGMLAHRLHQHLSCGCVEFAGPSAFGGIAKSRDALGVEDIHPLTQGIPIHIENVGQLLQSIAFSTEQQGMCALAFAVGWPLLV